MTATTTPRMNLPARTEVLIVGAGPPGLMLANELRRWRGVRTLIIDWNLGPSLATKALGVQAPTLEIYPEIGIAEHVIERGQRASAVNLWVQGKRAAARGCPWNM
ncbi:MAG: FAD-dependent monooxygenase [Gammaproteobacteria bacterium]